MNKTILGHHDIARLSAKLSYKLIEMNLQFGKVYPIPRGGVPAAYATYHPTRCSFVIVNTPEEADFFIDDIIDSGETMKRYCDEYPGKGFFALIDKLNGEFKDQWVVFPWEVTAEGSDESATDIVTRLLEYVGEDSARGGLLDTPKRVLKAWTHWCSGYGADISKLLKTFEDGAEDCDEMVVRVVPFYSHCEHHMAAIIGHAIVAYIPNKKIVGLSKIDRVVDAFARRLQVQERLTNQIAEAIMTHLEPKGVGVWINARHLCIESRGVQNAESGTDTLALRGVFKDDARTRAEFIAVARTKVQ